MTEILTVRNLCKHYPAFELHDVSFSIRASSIMGLRRCRRLLVGTGETPLTISFYKNCGFRESHRVKNFFIDNYDHPIFEDGIQLKDMIYLEMEMQCP